MSRKQCFAGGICLLFVVVITLFSLYENGKVYRECYVEAGVEVTVQDFLKNPAEKACFASDSDQIDITQPGEYHIKIETGCVSHESTLYITDTIAPEGKPVKVNLDLGEECGADAFVSDISDATQVEAVYVQKPDFNTAGKQKVDVMLTDLGGNQSLIRSELFISQVVSELTVEAGSSPPGLKDFVIDGENAEFISDINVYDYTVPGEKTVSLRVDGTVYKVVMHIVDTVAPQVKVQDVRSFTLVPRTVEEFIVSASDATDITAAFVQEPDVTFEGEQTVQISVMDAGGNETVCPAKLTLEKDTEAPVIEGVADLSVFVGESVFYKKNVTVKDNCPQGLQLNVDNSAVNLRVEGTYSVTYTARDYAGNETTAEALVTVRVRVYDEAEVYALADGVLARILTPEMTATQKLEAIYRYIQTHITYLNHSEKESWVRAAYEGLAEGKGDCYVYACTAKALLTRAGITNMDIAKIPAKTSHYWNLVNIGDGWYHFDTTPRVADHPYIFMWTEEQLMAYSAIHYGSHNYDHSLYPEVN